MSYIQDAVVECPDDMVYLPLEVTQGVPPFGGVNGLDDFVAAGCDGTNATCVVRTLYIFSVPPIRATLSKECIESRWVEVVSSLSTRTSP